MPPCRQRKKGICHPILLGNDKKIYEIAKEMELDLDGIEVLNLRNDDQVERRERYAAIFAAKKQREGCTLQEANDKMYERNYFGMMMVENRRRRRFDNKPVAQALERYRCGKGSNWNQSKSSTISVQCTL